ncbi:hypothetical protein KM043_003762 [Ampulex compressa]|nr:hypothetical protein KM043_003762 [Ampulex compressa]
MNIEDRAKKEENGDLRRAKANSAEKAFVKSLLKLKQQEDMLNKGLETSMSNLKVDSDVIRSMLDDSSELSTKRQQFLDNVKKNLYNIIDESKAVKSIIDGLRGNRAIDVDSCKARLINLSKRIREFKESCPLDTLREEQAVLESELREFELILRKYENANREPTFSVQRANEKDKKEDKDYSGVQDFLTLVSKTGHTGNWSNEDHLLFLKVRKKCNGIPALITAIQTKCPDLTVETIVNHEAWYKLYLSLREEQKCAVKNWRKQRDSQKIKGIGTGERRDDEKYKGESFQKKTVSQIVGESCVECNGAIVPEKVVKTIAVGDDKKELIRKWRTDKERKRSMDEEQTRIRMEAKRTLEEKRKRERLKKIQETLSEYRRQKSMEAALKAPTEEKAVINKHDPQLIKAFRKQDEKYIHKRKEIISRSQTSSKKYSERISRSDALIFRNESTLLNSTKVWNERCKLEDSAMKHRNESLYIKDIPKLCTRWRNEESMIL